MADTVEILDLVDASIADLRHALDTGVLTSVELVSLYLHRIGKYDCNGPCLNSVPVLNRNLFHEAQASDDYRASGRPARPLEGIPFTVKDSFKVAGMTVAAGSPAFADLTASCDAVTVENLRRAGAIVLGKTNMPAMADGGAQRGLYGRAESPYNPEYAATAVASGSSNGSGTSTTASFASFGLGGETVSSGRSPASYNALVGYSPSRGVIPSRGQWPLYPTCDVITPHTRTMRDLFEVLDVIVKDDPTPTGEFWRKQTVIPIPEASDIRPRSYQNLADASALNGKRIAVPKHYIGIADESTAPAAFTSSVRELWAQAKADLESLGATIIETDFPLLQNYTRQHYSGQCANVPGFPMGWNAVERCKMIAMGWDDFLRANNDEKYPYLAMVDPAQIHPMVAPMDDPTKYTEVENHVRYEDIIGAIKIRDSTIHELPGCAEAIKALEAARKRDLEDWLRKNDFALMAFPTNGDIARADAEENYESMMHALQDGVKYANGGRALKHLGVPAITVPMGNLSDIGMPVGLTFVSGGHDDNNLLRYAFAYEEGTRRRVAPPRTPPLLSDRVYRAGIPASQGHPVLRIESNEMVRKDSLDIQTRKMFLAGTVDHSDRGTATVTVFVNGEPSEPVRVKDKKWEWQSEVQKQRAVDRYPTLHTIPRDQFMIVIIAKGTNGRATGELLLVD